MSVRSFPRPIVGVGTVVFCGDKVLLIKRSNPPKADEWSLPGGKQELGETLVEAARREVLEETGIIAEIKGLVDVVDFIDRSPSSQKIAHHYTLIDYWGICTADTVTAGSDAKAACFYSLEEALALPLWSETKRIILAANALYVASRQETAD
ncbi:DNA mismatch repair protein MutT [Kordiimonas sediminis]|uniref:DNA mismatch repair protein MutT n=1 Tax=Kordiimonas sediminis TaxID=1735581 RepID=A0A919ARH2_9PROT|nr:NUDIX hydrolase [Kordiimonas sediminis]GHF23506.1 DNA mismatch repair protein MutT [Kordiimonas sediminis]